MPFALTAGQIYQEDLSTHLQSWPSHSSILHSTLFCCELTRVNPYIHPAAQPPLTFLTPWRAPLQSEALQIEPAWGQVAGRTRLKSGLVDLCGSQLLLALLSTFISSVPSNCPHLIQTQVLPLSGNNSPSISPWSSFVFLLSLRLLSSALMRTWTKFKALSLTYPPALYVIPAVLPHWLWLELSISFLHIRGPGTEPLLLIAIISTSECANRMPVFYFCLLNILI